MLAYYAFKDIIESNVTVYLRWQKGHIMLVFKVRCIKRPRDKKASNPYNLAVLPHSGLLKKVRHWYRNEG
jgi:hypothetical protein